MGLAQARPNYGIVKLGHFSYLGYHNNEWTLLGTVDKSESWQFGKGVNRELPQLRAEPATNGENNLNTMGPDSISYGYN